MSASPGTGIIKIVWSYASELISVHLSRIGSPLSILLSLRLPKRDLLIIRLTCWRRIYIRGRFIVLRREPSQMPTKAGQVLNLRQFTKLRSLVAVVLRAETGPVWQMLILHFRVWTLIDPATYLKVVTNLGRTRDAGDRIAALARPSY